MGSDICITTLIENNAFSPGLSAEHGLSFWIECDDRHILFDTGQSDLLVQNAKVLNIDLAQADAIVLSHGHYDHTGGLSAVLDIAPNAPLYLHPAAIEPKFSRGSHKSYSIGMPDSVKKAIHNRQVIWTESTTSVFDGVCLTGQIPRTNSFEDTGGQFFLDEEGIKPDRLLDDQALFVESSKGLVVILGCTHAGVVNTLQQISNIKPGKDFYAIMGGMHLINAGSERIERTIDTFREYALQQMGPAHCTGSTAVERIRDAFPERCFDCSAGIRIRF